MRSKMGHGADDVSLASGKRIPSIIPRKTSLRGFKAAKQQSKRFIQMKKTKLRPVPRSTSSPQTGRQKDGWMKVLLV